MQAIHKRQTLIQEKRKKTDFRDFLREIASRCPVNLYKIDGKVSRYPQTDRLGALVTSKEFMDGADKPADGPWYDSTKDFFQQYDALQRTVGLPYLWHFGSLENCDFADTVWFGAKNVYLTICAWMDLENILYSFYVVSGCRNVFNSAWVNDNSENIYYCSWVSKSFNVFYSKYMYNCSNMWFSTNCTGCQECLFCSDLVNQSYCIENTQYTKEEYVMKKKQLLSEHHNFAKRYSMISNDSKNIGSENSTGKCVLYSEDVQNGVFVTQVRHGRNLVVVGNGDAIEHIYDNITSASNAEHSYGNMGASPWSHIYCSLNSGWPAGSHNIYYCNYVLNCKNCIGCVGLKDKEYCILNKQYSKEEWESVADVLFARLHEQEQLGEFFPWWMNPFYFNDTAACLLDQTFTKDEVNNSWYLWRDDEIKVDIPDRMEVVTTDELSEYEKLEGDARSIDSNILKKVIKDPEWNSYRIVKLEYDFLVKHGLPLPRKHWLERMKENFKI